MDKLPAILKTLLTGLLATLSGCGSLTSESQWVYVNAIDELDGLRCTWSGSQAFDATNDQATVRFRVLPYGRGPNSYILTVLATAAPGISLETESIRIGLVASGGSGDEQRFHLSAIRAPLVTQRTTVGGNPQRESWFQQFSISPEVVDERGITYFLILNVPYRDAAGIQRKLSGKIPLRRVKIVIPTSLV